MLRLVFVAIAGWMLTGAAVALYDPIIGFSALRLAAVSAQQPRLLFQLELLSLDRG